MFIILKKDLKFIFVLYSRRRDDMFLKEIPVWERPREKLMYNGVDTLSNQELIAILLRTGSKEQNVLELSEKILVELESIADMSSVSINELTQIKGIGLSKAITLLAAVELGKRINSFVKPTVKVNSPSDVYRLLKNDFQHKDQEYFIGIYLNSQSEMVAKKIITIGNNNSTIFDNKELLKWALKYHAAGVIIAHNHPSGNSNPSLADIKITKVLIEQANLLEINLLDHIIIGKDYYSFQHKTDLFKNKV